MRLAIIAESAAPSVNGVARSVQEIQSYGQRHGHEVRVYSPAVGQRRWTAGSVAATQVRVPGFHFPGVPGLPLGIPTRAWYRDLQAFQPEVIHLASPLAFGAAGAWAAQRLQVPVVGVYQTDIPAYTRQYGVGFLETASWRWLRSIHKRCDRTLAPSRPVQAALAAHGIPRLQVWGRGVDTELFHPRRRDPELHARWAGPQQRIVAGYVGRLAPEKELHKLAPLAADPAIQLVIVGAGPAHPHLDAIYTGALQGKDLARALASFDVFVHPGSFETFCQTIQEAHASGVPTVAAAAGGPLDLVQPHNGTLLAPETYAPQVAAAVQAWAPRRASSAAQIRAGVAHRSWEVLCAELFACYDEVLRQHG